MLQPLAPGRWWVAAADGDADEANRGRVSNLLLAADGDRLWLLGSGPSPAAGRALACAVRQVVGRAVTDVVSPWPRPELVLGVGGLAGPGQPAPRHWAHAEVAQAMAERCPVCVQRLAQRLGAARHDLGPAPVALPTHLLHGDQGRLGPWAWWRLSRGEGHPVTVWRLATAAGPLWASPGLLNGDGPGDARDARLAALQASTARLAALSADDGPAARHLGEQGPPQPATAPARHADYWRALPAQVRRAMDQGVAESAPAGTWPGLPDAWARHPWHALNWQRAWREVEQDWLPPSQPPGPPGPSLPPPPRQAPQRGDFQRSLR